MAALTKLDISGQAFNENVFNKPPVPSRPASGKFHNRGSGKLFPSTAQNRLFTETDETTTKTNSITSQRTTECTALVVHPSFVTENDNSEPNTPRVVPHYRRRTQSAKAKTSNTKEPRKHLKTRPQSAGNLRRGTNNESSDHKKPAVIDITNEIMPDLFDIERDKLLALPCPRTFNEIKPPMYFHRQHPDLSDHCCEKDTTCFCKKETLTKRQQKGLKPSVYGLDRQRHVYGSAPDLSCGTVTDGQFPYKMSNTPVKEVLPEKEESPSCSLPHTLEPLLPWLQGDIPEEVVGVNPADCLVFLSPVDWSDLPEVPEQQDPEGDLPFIKDITTPKKWSPKKYGHPFNKQPVEEWVCKHKSFTTENDAASQKLNVIYRQTVRLPRMRNADYVRKEITELENVLKGIGTMDSNCGLVQYQEEISHFKDLLDVTLNMIPERLKNVPEPEDMFGIRKMCADHDLIIKNIKERVRECRLELADLEVEAGIQTDRQYFRKTSSSLL